MVIEHISSVLQIRVYWSEVSSPGSQEWLPKCQPRSGLSGGVRCKAAGWNVTCQHGSLQRTLCHALFHAIYLDMYRCMLGCCASSCLHYACWRLFTWVCFLYRDKIHVCVCLMYITWPCQSIFLCRPFHTQLPAPDPEIPWPHPQTAASVSMHTHNTCILRYRSATESMKYSCF